MTSGEGLRLLWLAARWRARMFWLEFRLRFARLRMQRKREAWAAEIERIRVTVEAGERVAESFNPPRGRGKAVVLRSFPHCTTCGHVLVFGMRRCLTCQVAHVSLQSAAAAAGVPFHSVVDDLEKTRRVLAAHLAGCPMAIHGCPWCAMRRANVWPGPGPA